MSGPGQGGAPATPEARKQYYAEWYSCDGHYDGEVRTVGPDGPWPGMVGIELSFGANSIGLTLTADDARELAAHIAVAAEWAAHETKHAHRARGACAPSPGAPATPDTSE